ncbi:GumC family protein [Sphingobium chlorophenolicum]|uniref:non-specific protein-tyrosine kinase n=1 Tax=Sphingobium chlorophenolicum TaxID=46429 RepID=A0A081RGC9_SPHCR|nr:AAA family ATPase [Sphingobium chlorophenolicum]KEQ54252.1 Capsular exopolysaccharide family protein [Sphingobium chlorophenolicum]
MLDQTGASHADITAQASASGIISSLNTAVIGMFRRRWRTFAIVSTVAFTVAAALILMMPWKYSATARVKIDPSANAALGQMSGNERPDQNIFDTEVNVMRSRDIAKGVVRELRLDSNPEFVKGLDPLPARPTAHERDEFETALADRLLGNLETARDKMTYIVNVGYTAREPAAAAAIANAFATQYIAYSVGRRTGTASRETSYLDQRLATLNDQAVQADARLAQYRATAGIVSGGDTSVTDQQIAPLASQLATAQSEAAAASAKLAAARAQVASGGLDAVSAVLNSQVIADLRSQRAQLIQRQGEVLSRYGPKHPESVKVIEQLRALDAQIKDEADRIIGGLVSEASAANARAASLRSDMGRLRSQQSTDTRASVMADTYQRQADAAHSAYNKLAEQAQGMSQVARSALTQAQVIETAVPPAKPTSPNRKLLLALAFIGAVAAGSGVVLMREILAKGLYSVADLERLGVPVLASIPRIDTGKLRDADGRPCSAPATLINKAMSSYAESYRVLRRSLLGRDGADMRVITIVSSLPDEGKTSSSLTLARICAMAGEKVLLIDTDLRRAGLREAAGIDVDRGLVEILTGDLRAEDAIVQDAVAGLDILPVASTSFVAEDLFSGRKMRDLIDAQSRIYDRIIIDTPPLLGLADARTVALLADAVVLVVKWGDTPANAVKTSLSWLTSDDARLAGAIFSMVDAGEEAYGALYYSRKYSHYYHSE